MPLWWRHWWLSSSSHNSLFRLKLTKCIARSIVKRGERWDAWTDMFASFHSNRFRCCRLDERYFYKRGQTFLFYTNRKNPRPKSCSICWTLNRRRSEVTILLLSSHGCEHPDMARLTFSSIADRKRNTGRQSSTLVSQMSRADPSSLLLFERMMRSTHEEVYLFSPKQMKRERKWGWRWFTLSISSVRVGRLLFPLLFC